VNINGTGAETFDFDDSGNLLSLTVGNTTTGFTVNNLNQRITPGVNVYDPKGQTTNKDGRTFEWDDDGRMTAIVMGTHRSEFAYDGYGRRIKIAELDNGALVSKKLYWWLGGEIVCERDGIDPAFPITKRYFGQGVVVGAERLFYTFDQLGSVRELVDSTGVVRADYRYSTYGERTKVGGDLDSDWGYAGLFHHGPSGLDLATYRTYDSKMGRWLSRDPLGEGVDYNLYRYCGNNPISCIDPTGESPLVPVATFSHWIQPTNNGYDLAVVGHTPDWYFPATTFNVTLEAPFSVLSSAGELSTRWNTLSKITLDLIPMSRGQGASAYAEIPRYKLKNLADEGVCKVRLTFAGQNSIFSAWFTPPTTYEATLNSDGTLSNIELLDLHLGNQAGTGIRPSNN
jgi:RHS repeat-associated protein